MNIAIPGNVDIHHDVSIYGLPSFTIEPQEGAGGGMPTPRKLREASVMMTAPIRSPATTNTGAHVLGIMWRNMILILLAPMALTTSTY